MNKTTLATGPAFAQTDESWDEPDLFDLDVRRGALLDWLNGRDGVPVTRIVAESGLYRYMSNGRYDRCLGDLKALARMRLVVRGAGRPALWRVGTPRA